MCGIVGFFSSMSETNEVKLRSACASIEHRGPDARGIYLDQGVGLGHQRLSIIDLSDIANQPMSDATEQVVLVYNGELYNYRELRKELLARGHTFRTNSDTEVLLHMYLEYGKRCLLHLDGMFAFAVWDKRDRTLFLARDRLGIKPLYYRLNGNMFSFASEIKALLALDDAPTRIDRQALHDYLTFRYVISPRTMFQGIKKLPPAHSLLVSEAGLKTERYWSPDYEKKENRTEEEWIQSLRGEFIDVVSRHLVSDVPVGVLLSGGLDSSVVAAVMQAGLTKPIKTFSIAFSEGGAYDERPFARKMARHLGTDHYEIVISHQEFVDALPAYIWHMDEPVADPASIPLYYLSQLARRHVKVVLSGEGSDELLGGYVFGGHFKGYNRLKVFKRIPKLVQDPLLRSLNEYLFQSERLERYLQMSRYPLSSYGCLAPIFQDNVFDEAEKHQLYRADFQDVLPLEDSVEQVRDAYRNMEDCEFLDQMLFVSMTQWLPEDVLIKADKMTMAHSLELRVPFLDHTLVDSINRMPTALKVRKNGNGYVIKYALKKAFADIIPREILEREKIGFAVPYAKWFKNEMRPMLHDVLLSQTARESGILNPTEMERLLKVALEAEESPGKEIWDPRAKKIWSLFVFELWRQRFNVAYA
jgi:asparagine synthase (glutamine-hydrolysing)